MKDLEQLIRKQYGLNNGTLKITDVKRREVYSIGNFDSDYVEHFNGLSVYGEE